jgi:hypothetical protein
MPRLGRGFEEVVADVLKAMDPAATVSIGPWVPGSDGRREVDVLVEGTADGDAIRVIVECKDFDPKKTGPVGIQYLDSLDSKRRDLNAKIAIVASNAGFTSDAIRKGKRLGIGVVGIMRKGDARLRFAVEEEVYSRQISVRDVSGGFEGDNPEQIKRLNTTGPPTFDGKTASRWLIQKLVNAIGANPIVQGRVRTDFNFLSSVNLVWPGGTAPVNFAYVEATIAGAWFAHQVTLDATSGVYDWVRRRVRMAAGSVSTKNIDFYRGKRISRPPEHELQRYTLPFVPGEVDMRFVMLVPPYQSLDDAPQLDPFVRPSDLATRIAGLSDENITSLSAADFPSAKP